MNEAIYKQPLVLFLGAGASTSLGQKTTVEFLEWLKTQPDIDYGHLTSICNQIEPSKEAGEKLDVEVILDYLEKLIMAGDLFEKSGDAEILRWLREELSKQTGASVSPLHPYGSITRLDENIRLRDRIKDLMIEHYSEIDNKAAFELYSPLLPKLADPHPLAVFTTNYDLAIEKLHESGMIELIDGFNREKYLKSRWSREQYDFYDPSDRSGDVILFKLHGSVDWVRTPSEGIQRVDIPKRNLGGAPRVIAYPSQLKREIHEEPYRTNYDYLIACLLHAKACAVIGFSFRDQEIVEEFRQAMELNEDLQIIIIDPEVEAVKRQLESKVGFKCFESCPLGLDSKARPTSTPTHTTICEKLTPKNAASIGDRIVDRLEDGPF